MSISGEIENVKHELKVKEKEINALAGDTGVSIYELAILKLRLKALEEVNHKNYTGRKDK